MSRVHVKGGPWSNSEDEVLKAALAEYGLRDWERVASMLTKKTAAQCRERWENYVDPRLHLKEAWTPEEEEKLVELQTLFPNQWRLIAEQLTRSTPSRYIRPAWLCEQHYLEVRDAHEYEKQKYAQQQQRQARQQQKQQSGASGASAVEAEDGEDVEEVPDTLEDYLRARRQRRAAYQAHEEKAARADTVGSGTFEEEMITMAVSRLANQDQKKGLRKERQRRLEEASFLAKLESNRESIESGTLSARQEKRMRRALEEDKAGRQATARRRGEDGGDMLDDDDDDDAATDEAEEEEFQAFDVNEDKEEAGNQKKSRTLLMDLGKQQQKIASLESSRTDAKGYRTRAADEGVDISALDQLTTAPSAVTATAAPSLATAAGAVPRITSEADPRAAAGQAAGTTWESLAGPTTDAVDLDELFAALPDVVESAGAGTGAPAATPAGAAVQDGKDDGGYGDAPKHTDRRAPAHAGAHLAPLQPMTEPRSAVHTTAKALVTPPRSVRNALSAEPFDEQPARALPHTATGVEEDVWAAAAHALLGSAGHDAPPDEDSDRHLAVARQLVAVETERLFMAQRRQRGGVEGLAADDVSAPDPWQGSSGGSSDNSANGPPSFPSAHPHAAVDGAGTDRVEPDEDIDSAREDRHATASLPATDPAFAREVEVAKQRLSALTALGPSSVAATHRTSHTTQDSEVWPAVATVQRDAQYYASLTVSPPALRALEADVRQDVDRVNAALAKVEEEVASIAVTCYMNPGDRVLGPYVDGSGHRTVADGALLHYVRQDWARRLQTSRLEASCLTQLRAKEQYEMTRQLAAAQTTLAALTRKEARLQVLYREVQERGHGAPAS